jgi:threonyl-tRNA synthetase
VKELRSKEVRVKADYENNPIKAKVADAEKARVHTMLVIGPRDVENGKVSVRLHGKGHVGAREKAEVIANIVQSIAERKAN